MNSKKALFAIVGGVALTTVIGLLFIPYRDASRRKKIIEKARDFTNTAEEAIKDSVANVKNQLPKTGKDTDQMVNEGAI